VSVDDSEFGTELRGYKRSEVDEAIGELRGELIKSNKDRARALEDLKKVQEELAELSATARESSSPSYSGLGGRLEAMLRIAEEQATRIISQADIDADLIHDRARRESEELLVEATSTAKLLVEDAESEANATLNEARTEAEQLLASATEEARETRQEAIEEAAAIRGQVSTETAKMRASAKREADALRAETEREMAEKRVVVDRELGEAKRLRAELERDIEVEKATHELTLRKIQEEAALAKTTMEREVAEKTAELRLLNEKQEEKLQAEAERARADLDMELAARRHEAEKEVLGAHQKAIELNESFQREANQQLDDTKARLRKVRDDHKKLSAAINELNTHGKADAEKESRQLIADAEKKAAALVADAERQAEEKISQMESRLVELRTQRDTIADYLASLRQVVHSIDQGAATAADATDNSGRGKKVK
jgi:cell division septum initiation protein DivIVA